MASAAIRAEDYRQFRDFLERACGIVLGDSKQYLVASRLGPIMSEHGFGDLGQLVTRLPASGGLRAQVIEAMTTNETQFFRDGYPFSLLAEHVLPALQAARICQPRIWSAACSSGQEAYSISMTVQEFNQRAATLDAQILGTDVSPQMVAQARLARFNAAAIGRGLSHERRERFFTRVENQWEARPEIRRRTSFREHNLLESYAPLGRFDVIFCRNVLIYFSVASRRDILSRMAQALNPGGFLVLGASESLVRQGEEFELLRLPQGVLYRLRDKARAHR